MKGKKGMVGTVLIVLGFVIWGVYLVVFYIPTIMKDMTNANAIIKAMVVLAICVAIAVTGIWIEGR